MVGIPEIVVKQKSPKADIRTYGWKCPLTFTYPVFEQVAQTPGDLFGQRVLAWTPANHSPHETNHPLWCSFKVHSQHLGSFPTTNTKGTLFRGGSQTEAKNLRSSWLTQLSLQHVSVGSFAYHSSHGSEHVWHFQVVFGSLPFSMQSCQLGSIQKRSTIVATAVACAPCFKRPAWLSWKCACAEWH